MKVILLFCFLAILSFLGCKTNSTSIEDTLIEKCISAHGGIDNWTSLTNTIYRKDITLFDKEGKIEKIISQKHRYSKNPDLSGTIEWADSINRKITYSGESAFKTNGTKKENSSQAALNTFNSAYYVLNMPWKLLDESAEISYLGLDTILNIKVVHTLRIIYPSEDQKDVWEYYLDEKNYSLVANMVHHGSTYSLITNDEFVSYKDLKFNSKRTSYMVDSLGDVLYLRAKYEYVFE